MTLTSRIYHHGPGEEPKGAEADRRNKEAFAKIWHEKGLLVIYPDWVLNWDDNQHLKNIGNEQYGKRRDG